MNYAGCDFGINGIIAIISKDLKLIDIIKMPHNNGFLLYRTLEDTNILGLYEYFKKYNIAGLTIEEPDIHGIPNKYTALKIGQNSEGIVGLCRGMNIDVQIVKPSIWKSHYGITLNKKTLIKKSDNLSKKQLREIVYLNGKTKRKNKKLSILKAIKLFGTHEKLINQKTKESIANDNIGDACCLGHYGIENLF